LLGETVHEALTMNEAQPSSPGASTEAGSMVVTGATDGIGRATAIHLARAGFPVIFTARSRTKAEAVLAELRSAGPGLPHAFVEADFSLMVQVRQAAEQIIAMAPKIRSLVHCAGIIENRVQLTPEGIELNFAVNYLSRYLMTRRLLPALEQSADPRVVIVAAAGFFTGAPLDLNAIERRDWTNAKKVFQAGQYANDLFGLELLSRAGPKVAVSIVRPGMVRTNLRKKSSSLPWFFHPFEVLTSLFGESAESSARTPFLLASDPSMRSLSGQYVGPSIRTRPRIPQVAKEPGLRARLWDISEKLVREHL
jgi:NAD(P)-dependent dehydrogenase (short-subunit alcohol dehydrogenase family)